MKTHREERLRLRFVFQLNNRQSRGNHETL